MAHLKPSSLKIVFYWDKPQNEIQKEYEVIEELIKDTRKSIKEKEEEIKTSIEAKELQTHQKTKRIKLIPSESKNILTAVENNDKLLYPSVLMLEREHLKNSLYKRMAKRKEYQYYLYDKGLSCFAFVTKSNYNTFWSKVAKNVSDEDYILLMTRKNKDYSFWGGGVKIIYEICLTLDIVCETSVDHTQNNYPYKMTLVQV